jgi:hypothetical protein
VPEQQAAPAQRIAPARRIAPLARETAPLARPTAPLARPTATLARPTAPERMAVPEPAQQNKKLHMIVREPPEQGQESVPVQGPEQQVQEQQAQEWLRAPRRVLVAVIHS